MSELFIGVLHLTDIHFKSIGKNEIINKFEKLVSSVKTTFIHCEKIYIFITGDIAFSGKESEYDIAFDFINRLKLFLIKTFKVHVDIILVPGNHDCDFSINTDVRDALLNSTKDSDLTSDSIIETCIKVQDSFWAFYGKLRSLPNNKIYYKIDDKVGDKTISFHCLNTAWSSNLKEKSGSLKFSTKYLIELSKSEAQFNVCLYHHPATWLSHSAENKSKTNFESFVGEYSNLQFSGHDHEISLKRSEVFNKREYKTYLITGNVLQEEDASNSGFNVSLINLSNLEINLHEYLWSDDFYLNTNSIEFNLSDASVKKEFELKEHYINSLKHINLPISLKQNLGFLDLFVYPDLEEIVEFDSKKFQEYLDSEKLIEEMNTGFIFISGDSQIGKTSLLKKVFFYKLEQGIYPIFIKGSEITNDNINRVIKNAFYNSYQHHQKQNIRNELFQKFEQLAKDKKVLIIDDFHNIKLNESKLEKIFKEITISFTSVYVSIDKRHTYLSQFQLVFGEYKHYEMKSFGNVKKIG